ncbi:MAG: translational GTPase TypA [Kiritimatiellae bacterium]|nr:translational GTPase TypA [Kiritimatiellia bacterium]
MTELRNIAIIAHVDHGKTTLVDQLLKQANIFRHNEQVQDCFLDSNALERERGITILSKNISIEYRHTKINLIDTPGHSDFGGQVERVLKLADGVLLLVDAAEGPMPQTRFVLDKALGLGLKPIVVINKIDKPDARHEEVLDKVFDLFVELDAHHEQLDFPVLYGSGRDGWMSDEPEGSQTGMLPLLDAVVEHIPAPIIQDGPVQMQVASIDYSEYVGRIGVGRVYRGELRVNRPLVLIKNNGEQKTVMLKQLFSFEGLGRESRDVVACGDLCAAVGVEGIDIGDTLADPEEPEALPPIHMDEPTISMVFRVNDSPLFGQDGRFVSGRHLRERLFREAERDVALRVDEEAGESFKVSGRGVLHLAILIETMRREGYELSVATPHVILKQIDGESCEPFETLSVDVPEPSSGRVIELVGMRRGEMTRMDHHGARCLLEFNIPTRGVIGLRSRLLTATAGEAVVSHVFSHYEPQKGVIAKRQNGVLVSMERGDSVAYALDALQQRGFFFIAPGEACYQGMIVGEGKLESDLVVNVQKGKQLTNMRASGSDRNMKIAPPVRLSLEETLEYIAEDELVEVTPKAIRMRKKLLAEHERKAQRRKAAITS